MFDVNAASAELSNKDLLGFIVSPSSSAMDSGGVEVSKANEALQNAGFGGDWLIAEPKLSSLYLDTIREHQKYRTNIRKNLVTYQFDKVFHDGVEAMRISHVVFRKVREATSENMDNEASRQVARIDFKFNNSTRAYEMEIEGEEADLPLLQSIRKNFEDRLRQVYDAARMTEILKNIIVTKFEAIRVRQNGGLYLVEKQHGETFIEYFRVLSSTCKGVNCFVFPALETDEVTKSSLAVSTLEDFFTSFKNMNTDIVNSIEKAEEKGQANFRRTNISNQFVQFKEMQDRAKQLSRTLSFDYERLKFVQEELEKNLKRMAVLANS